MGTKPILFNTEMVQAILDGRKTVTRRIANINTEITCNDGTTNHDFVLDNFGPFQKEATGFVCRRCGFGVAFPHSRVPCGTSLFRPRYWPGDILYVRETWCRGKVDAGEEPDGREVLFISQCLGEDDIIPKEWAIRNDIGIEDVVWRPSIHMPKEAARIFLRVKDVRVERLNDMHEEDAIAEGFPDLGVDEDSPLERFSVLWDKTIKREQVGECDWYSNPWVWVIEFEKISKEEAMKC